MVLEELLLSHRIPFKRAGEHHHVREGWVGIDCPWCIGRGKYLLGINRARLYAVCWRCGPHSLPDVLMSTLRMSYAQARALLDGMPAAARGVRPVRPVRDCVLPKCLGPLQPPHIAYLERRGFDPDAIQRLWRVQGIGVGGALSWRVWLPMLVDGEVVTWTARAVGTKEPRYKSCPADQEARSIKSILYGVDYCRHGIIVHEGPIDVWATGPGAVSVNGLLVSTAQLDAIGRHPVRAICFDAEPAAQRRARALAAKLAAYPGTTSVVALETGKDPAEADVSELQDLRGAFLV